MTNNNTADYTRYHRQMLLPGIGLAGQQKLAQARVLVIGAGGLGCPVLMSLAGAGVGLIGVADDGLVELSNLHRQFLYRMEDIGQLKVICAQQALQALNPQITVHPYPVAITVHNALEIISNYDIIIDGTDNFPSRYLINDACALLSKPLIYGAVSRYEGQVALFTNGITYRDVFAQPPRAGEIENCSEAGVMGVLPGIIGGYMANECIKWITGTGELLTGQLLTYSALNHQQFIIQLSATEAGAAALPASREAFVQTDYPAACGVSRMQEGEIDAATLHTLLQQDRPLLVDVRELHETLPGITWAHLRIPLSVLAQQLPEAGDTPVVFICQSGKRSLQALTLFKQVHASSVTKAYSLAGGLQALHQHKP
ncbi:adenylyltransferase and sulfurtransferase [Filimonas lacunae]|uniref:Molybdopterin-synthase adenylyltransferase n=1 Tax=Filimonas lacunae TaxID=477680 RepID=A0A173MHT3_9BACT|nr:HesA/MoeB/ThiF family protein [Filimonas lacunae]BAV07037.1 sulfur carrier protein adenylyltransferase ThiF [Filimonas lacunae]SIS95924.1 adenylyltransferase and sulfurtransferase [Filimonas lacunae]